MRKSIWISIASILLLVVIFLTIYKIVESKAQKIPANSPAICVTQTDQSAESPGHDGRKRVILIGDSITHGTVSFNYVDYLQDKLGGQGFEFINAGINSNLAYNVVQRLPEIHACQPDYVIILIGTNDVNATLSESRAQRYIQKMKLPRAPDQAWYYENYSHILQSLQQKTSARIAVLSLPVLGEDLNSAANRRVMQYSQTIQALARQYKVQYLPLNERQRDFLNKQTQTVQLCQGDPPVEMAVARHFLLRQSWDEIAARQGFYLTTDCLHMNRAGGLMIADLVEEFL